jgi:hypothetical protein
MWHEGYVYRGVSYRVYSQLVAYSIYVMVFAGWVVWGSPKVGLSLPVELMNLMV